MVGCVETRYFGGVEGSEVGVSWNRVRLVGAKGVANVGTGDAGRGEGGGVAKGGGTFCVGLSRDDVAEGSSGTR